MPKRMEEDRITAPLPGACAMCATFHGKDEPHDLGSLYYQNKFHRIYRRLPTWADALWHCSDETKKTWAEKLKSAGIEVTFPTDTEAQPGVKANYTPDAKEKSS